MQGLRHLRPLEVRAEGKRVLRYCFQFVRSRGDRTTRCSFLQTVLVTVTEAAVTTPRTLCLAFLDPRPSSRMQTREVRPAFSLSWSVSVKLIPAR